MKKLHLVIVVVFFLLIIAFLFVLYLSGTGKRESAWIRNGFWDANYFNNPKNELSKTDLLTILSLQKGASSSNVLVKMVSDLKCSDMTVECATAMVAGAALLIDHGESEPGVKLAVKANEIYKSLGECPVLFDSVVLKYKLEALGGRSYFAAQERARSLVDKVKSGGVEVDLKTQACNVLAEAKPELFHEYVLLVSRLMDYAGGNYVVAGAYIRSINKLNMELK